MNEEEINKMCSDIYEGEDWQPMKDYIKSLQTQLQQKENGFYKREEFLMNNIKRLEQKVVEKENIIKEVREYIENKEFINYKKGLGNFERMLKHRQELLEILDKENK